MNQKDKASQESLELLDSSVPSEQSDELSFVLKVHDGHLNDVRASTVINLLSALNQIVGIENAGFKTVQEGSITIALNVPHENVTRAIVNIQKITTKNNSQIKRIQKELIKYGFYNADISYGIFNNKDIYEPQNILLKIPEADIEEIFIQEDILDGRLRRLQIGKDDTDHITIVLNNGDEIPAECSHETLQELQLYFNTPKFLRFRGMASYLTTSNSYKLKLKKYIIKSFIEIENISIDDWIDNFRSKGSSNWSNVDDPISKWLRERQD